MKSIPHRNFSRFALNEPSTPWLIACLCVLLMGTASLAQAVPLAPIHVGNPYAGADKYVNPDYALSVERSIARTKDAKLAARMRSIEHTPTAIWLDRIDAIHGGERNNGRLGLESHLLGALAQQRNGVPMVVELVIYNLPNRDCSALSSNGTLDFRTGGLNAYKNDYIDVIAGLIQDPRFASLRFVLILEPDSLPNMVTNLWHPECAFVAQNEVYRQGVQYALQRFSRNRNSYLFMDIGHSGWLGWDSNLKSTVQFFSGVISGAGTAKGLDAVDGFVTNISNFTPTEETLLTDPDKNINGAPVKSADFYGWNPMFGEKRYIESLREEFVRAGFSRDIKFLIDTSRNGWGGANRPTRVSAATKANDYVEQSRIDRRFHRGNWCNPEGAGIGARPVAEPYGPEHPIAAFAWIKVPGESDGSSDPGQTGADAEGKRFDRMCDPTYVASHGPSPSGKPTGAMPHAPAAGHWFHEQFVMLVNNAYPALEPVSRNKK